MSLTFTRLLWKAAMAQSKDKDILECPSCGSRAFSIYGPTSTDGIVRCAECRIEIAPLEEFMATVEEHVQRQQQEQRSRRLH